MKVLQISKFYPPVMGGIESVAWELAEGLNRAGVRTDVLCSNQRRTTVCEHFPSGYDVTRAASLGTWLSTSVAPAMAAQVWGKAQDHDVIHLHMPDPMAALSTFIARPRSRIVVHWHSDVIRQRRALALYRPLQHWLLERADAIVATSPTYVDASEALRPWRSKVVVIPIGISDNRAFAHSDRAEAIRARYGHRRIVLSLGRMAYYKGFDVLIEAAAALPDDCVVVIGGDGELLDDYRRLVHRRGLERKVHLPGHIEDDDLPSHYEACDVFCMPSTVRAEAYGVAMLEAMVMGKPIVATDIGGSGVPWVNLHGVTGLNVPVRRSGPLARALAGLLADAPLREALGHGARARYEDNFNAELMTRRTIELYRHLAPAA